MKRKHFLWLTALVLFFVLPLSVQAAGTYYIEELDCHISLPDDWAGDTRESLREWDTEDAYWPDMMETNVYFYGDSEDYVYQLVFTASEDSAMPFASIEEDERQEWEAVTSDFYLEDGCATLSFEWMEHNQTLFLKTMLFNPAEDGTTFLDYTTVYDGAQYTLVFYVEGVDYPEEQILIADGIVKSLEFASNSEERVGAGVSSDSGNGYYDYDYNYDYDYGYEGESGAMDVVVQLLSRGAGIVAILMVVFLASRVRGGIRGMVSSRDVTNLLEKLGTMKGEGEKTQTKSASSETRPTANSGLNGLVDASKYDYAQRLEDYGLESPALPVCRKCKKKAQKPSRYCAFCDEELPKT